MTDAKRNLKRYAWVESLTKTKTQVERHVDGIWLGSEYLANESTKSDDLL